MIEAVMVFALGFLAASLGALLILPALSRRAERLACRRVEARLPMSLAELAAERDLLRAEMAVETRKIEMKAEAIARDKAQDMAEIGRGAVAIQGLEDKLAAMSGELARTQEDLAAVQADFAQRSRELEQTRAELQARSQSLAEKREAFAALEADHAKLGHVADERRIGIAALETAVEGQRAQILERERELQSVKAMLADSSKTLAETQTQAAVLAHRLTLAEESAAAREAALSELRAERDQIETERARFQAEAEAGAAAIAAEQAVKAEIDAALDALRVEFDAISRDYATSLDHLRSEKAAVTGALDTARKDRDRLEKDLKAAHRRLKSAGAERNGDDTLLRQEIQRVGAEVLRLVSLPPPPAPALPIDRMRDRKRAAKASHPSVSLPGEASVTPVAVADLAGAGPEAAAAPADRRRDIGGLG